LCRGHHGVRLVHDHGAPASLERPIVGAVDHIAYLIDLDRAGVAWLKDDDVRVHAPRDPPAGRTIAARVDLDVTGWPRLKAVQRLGDRNRSAAFADTPRPGQQQGRRQRVTRDRPRKKRQHTVVTSDRLKGHGSGYQAAGFTMTCDSSTSTSICVFIKQRYASSGAQTMGSSFTLNEVLTMIGHSVSSSKARMIS
jgi:hypothetical protein